MRKQALIVRDIEPWHQRPISATYGRLSAPLTAAVMGSTAPFEETISLENPEIRKMIAAAKRDKELSDVQVNLGSVRPIEQMGRIWTNKNTSLPSKLLGTVLSPYDYFSASLGRADHYDPFSNTVTTYTNEPAVLAHELGHAKDFKQKGSPGLYALSRNLTPLRLYQEYRASNNALSALGGQNLTTTERERTAARMNRILGGALGTYVGSAALLGLARYTDVLKDPVRRLAEYIDKHKDSLPFDLGHHVDPIKWSGRALGTGAILASALVGQGIGAGLRPFGTGTKEKNKGKKTMNKKSEAYRRGWEETVARFEKMAGPTSEWLGINFNPLNALGIPIGGLAALATPTRTPQEQAEAEQNSITNAIVPGVGPYNFFKRMGRSAANAGGAGYGALTAEILGGVPSAIAAGLSPLVFDGGKGIMVSNAITGGLHAANLTGALAAAFTKRRTLAEQAALDKNLGRTLLKFIPGVSQYDFFKRMGSTKAYDPERRKTDPEGKEIL